MHCCIAMGMRSVFILLCRSTNKYWLHLYGNSGYANMLECYIVYILPILSLSCLLP